MAFLKYMIAVVALVNAAYGLECYVCGPFDDPAKNCTNVEKAEECDPQSDVCIKVTTMYELPNNGPEDRTRDNPVNTYVTKKCGQKKSFERFAKIDKCSEETIGGGGSMETCMCVGNKCNTATHVTLAVSVMALAGVVKMLC